MVATADFPQADRLIQVGKVAEAIANGHYTDIDIERYIGLDSIGRQGRYYRQAAVVLGLITNSHNTSELTPIGQEYAGIAQAQVRLDFLAQRLVDTPVFHLALRYIYQFAPTDTQLRAWFRSIYPGAPSTADRRFSTFLAYMRDAKLVDYAKGSFSLNKYAGSVAKVSSGQRMAGTQRPLLPRVPTKIPPSAMSDEGAIKVDIDRQKVDRANWLHWKLVDAKSSFLSAKGTVPYDNNHIDLFAQMNGNFVIYEMKSVNQSGTNLLAQIRKAIAQLYEYRFIYGKRDAHLCIVTNCEIARADAWMLRYLERDRQIAYEWTEDFSTFNCGAASKRLTGSFAP